MRTCILISAPSRQADTVANGNPSGISGGVLNPPHSVQTTPLHALKVGTRVIIICDLRMALILLNHNRKRHKNHGRPARNRRLRFCCTRTKVQEGLTDSITSSLALLASDGRLQPCSTPASCWAENRPLAKFGEDVLSNSVLDGCCTRPAGHTTVGRCSCKPLAAVV